jgi:hypothetical protein
LIYPKVGIATLELLERFGLDVDYPLNQTCCGQPMSNSGDQLNARGAEQLFVEHLHVFAHPEEFHAVEKAAGPMQDHAPHFLLYNRSLNPWARDREMPEIPEQTFREWYLANKVGDNAQTIAESRFFPLSAPTFRHDQSSIRPSRSSEERTKISNLSSKNISKKPAVRHTISEAEPRRKQN